MAINRPRVVTELFSGALMHTINSPWTFFDSDDSGLTRISKQSPGSGIFQTVIDTGTGHAGVLQTLIVAVKNTDGVEVKNYAVRVTIDGTIVYEEEESIQPQSQSGPVLAGRLLWDGTGKPIGFTLGKFYFEDRLRVDIQLGVAGLFAHTIFKYYLTR